MLLALTAIRLLRRGRSCGRSRLRGRDVGCGILTAAGGGRRRGLIGSRRYIWLAHNYIFFWFQLRGCLIQPPSLNAADMPERTEKTVLTYFVDSKGEVMGVED